MLDDSEEILAELVEELRGQFCVDGPNSDRGKINPARTLLTGGFRPEPSLADETMPIFFSKAEARSAKKNIDLLESSILGVERALSNISELENRVLKTVLKDSEGLSIEDFSALCAAIRTVAIDHMRGWHDCHTVIFKQSGRGRSIKWEARNIAFWAAKVFLRVTGETPTLGTDNEGFPSTQYAKFLDKAFGRLGVDADNRRAAEWALDKIKKES